ncbi:MAG: DUF177 domain-containing protein [Candidatus Kapabacteria bacterium]|nr:DUF177 domain-containing protein [Candidatus Kapabacteria bacterium]MCS7169742.1 DUF177 domain-containing protein [Candidatus Kapabacteria bacterium]MDW7997734.1 DUF177 domain-containing protein [Bacteroidota bacterium]MDW8225621.1 DUF177 domain-containing protein [Bacteroidota bacterium]
MSSLLSIRIQGLRDGQYDVFLTAPAESVANMASEFFGEITLVGTLEKLGRRYTFVGVARCQARLVCDRTLEEYTEWIETPIEVAYLADTELYLLRQGEQRDRTYELQVIRDDDTHIDFSEEIRQELTVHLPMKRIAPQYREIPFEQLYPQYAAAPESKDERWAPLRRLLDNIE